MLLRFMPGLASLLRYRREWLAGDIAAGLAVATVALPVGKPFREAYVEYRGGPPLIQAGNLAGLPALSVPNGFGPNGLPTGIQFTGKAWSEPTLTAIAHAYQEQTDWHTRRPTIK